MGNSKSSRNCKVLLRVESFFDMVFDIVLKKNIEGKHMFYNIYTKNILCSILVSNSFGIIFKCLQEYLSQICVQKKQTYLPQGFAHHVYFK